MSFFSIKEKLESSSNLNFRKDEIKFLNKNLNKYYSKVFFDRNLKLQLVEKYLYEFFSKIEKSEFPLGHKYVNLNSKRNSDVNYFKDEDLDFFEICKNFYNCINNYKNECIANNKEENYVVQ